MSHPVPFTYYGGLLGIPISYEAARGAAYNQLDRFYTLSFEHLKGVCDGGNIHYGAQLFSDSLLFYGNDLVNGLNLLRGLYLALLGENLLLRGAVVRGAMQFDPRFTVRNSHNSIPPSESLEWVSAMALGCKGARLLVEAPAVAAILPEGADGQITGGFAGGPAPLPEIPKHDPRRYLSRTAEGPFCEFLYFYRDRQHPNLDHQEVSRRLRLLNDKVSNAIFEHYEATVSLIERCRLRSLAAKAA